MSVVVAIVLIIAGLGLLNAAWTANGFFAQVGLFILAGLCLAGLLGLERVFPNG